MISFKRSALVCCSLLASSLSLYGSDTSVLNTTKKSSKEGLFPGAYSSVQTRMYQVRDLKKGEDFKRTMQGRYTLGSTFFNERLDLSVTLIPYLEEGSTVVKDKGTSFDGELKVYSSTYYNLKGVANVTLPKTGKTRTSSALGGSHELSYKMTTGAGEFSASLEHALAVNLGNEADTAQVFENGKAVKTSSVTEDYRKEHNLVDNEGELYAEQESPKFTQELSLGLKWKPSYVKGLSLKVERNFEQTKSPRIELDRAATKSPLSHKSGNYLPEYVNENVHENVVGAKYEFNEEASWVSMDFAFSDTQDSGKRDYSVVGTVGFKLF